MSLTFWLMTAVLTALALALMLWPLLRPSRSGAIAAQASGLREQLEVLKSSHASGLISDADFTVRKQALSDAVLALVDRPVSTPTPRAVSVLALILLVTLPLALVLLYRQVGNPNALGFAGRGTEPPAAGAQPDALPENAPDLAAAAETLAAKLRDNPEDGEGWVLLGRTYRATEQFTPARAAFERALKLVPENADLLAEYAEVLGLASEPRSLAGEPEARLDRALVLDPTHQRALWLKGFARKQAGDGAAAEDYWNRLLAQIEPGSSVQTAVIDQINQARASQGKEPVAGAAAAAPPAPTADNAVAAPAAEVTAPSGAIAVQVDLAPELASKVAPGAVLFVFARAENGPPMPLAIQRLATGAFPVAVSLDASMGMLPNMSLNQFERVVIGARISMSGNAQAQAGDLETFSAGIEWRSAGRVDLTIDKVHE